MNQQARRDTVTIIDGIGRLSHSFRKDPQGTLEAISHVITDRLGDSYERACEEKKVRFLIRRTIDESGFEQNVGPVIYNFLEDLLL